MTTHAEKDTEIARLTALLNTPLFEDFAAAVAREAAHQVHRWGAEHDQSKAPADWFWTLAYLATKALQAHQAGDRQKALHHMISSAALLLHWHSHIKSGAREEGEDGRSSAAE